MLRHVTLIAILAIALQSAAAPRKGGKSVSGTVTDLNDNPVTSATVVVENAKTHRRITLKTDARGRFAAQNLKGTRYSVFVVAESSSNGVRLRLDGEDEASAVNRHGGQGTTAASQP